MYIGMCSDPAFYLPESHDLGWVMESGAENRRALTTGGEDDRQLCNSVAAMQDARVVTS